MKHYSKWGEVSSQTEKLKEKLQEHLGSYTPVDIFENTFTEDTFTHIKQETIHHAVTVKNDPLFCLDDHELKAFIGFLIYSGFVTVPSEHLYWPDADDLGQNIVRLYPGTSTCICMYKTTAVARKIADKGFKVQLLIDMLNALFKQYSVFHQNLSIDDMMVRCCGHHGLKQFIRGKPVGFVTNCRHLGVKFITTNLSSTVVMIILHSKK